MVALALALVADGQYAFELYYKFQVTDNISITPAIFWASDYRNNSGNSICSW